MAYFLGRDVSLALTTEHALCGLSVNENGDVFPCNVLIAEVNSIIDGTDLFSTAGATGLSTGDPFTFSMDAAQTISSGVTAGTVYYAILSGTHGVKAALTYADAVAGTAIDITGASAGETNITRELTHSDATGGNATPNTFIFNRNWPNHNGTGRIDTILSDSSSGDRRGIIPTAADAERNSIHDITGIDITLGKVDEDVVYFGQRTTTKLEIKNEVTVSITRKKTDHRYSALWNKARCGLISYTNSGKTAFDVDAATATSTLPAAAAVEINHSNATIPQPKNGNYGYRLHVILKSGSEVLTLRNMCMSTYTTTLSPDGITEESMEFYGYVDPTVDGDATFGYTTLTAVTEI